MSGKWGICKYRLGDTYWDFSYCVFDDEPFFPKYSTFPIKTGWWKDKKVSLYYDYTPWIGKVVPEPIKRNYFRPFRDLLTYLEEQQYSENDYIFRMNFGMLDDWKVRDGELTKIDFIDLRKNIATAGAWPHQLLYHLF